MKIRANEWAGIYSRTQRVQPNLREASMFEVDNACCSQPALTRDLLLQALSIKLRLIIGAPLKLLEVSSGKRAFDRMELVEMSKERSRLFFLACRAFCFSSHEKKGIKQPLKQEKLTGHREIKSHVLPPLSRFAPAPLHRRSAAPRCYFMAILSIKYSFCSSFCATERSKEPGTEIRDSNKALRSGRFVFAVVVFTRQIRERGNSLYTYTVQRCFPNAQTFTLCNLGCTRHNANKFAFCSRLHKLSPFLFLVCR